MAEIAFARTMSRQILSTMTDFDRMLDPAPGQSLISAALELAEAPCGPIAMESPDRVTLYSDHHAPKMVYFYDPTPLSRTPFDISKSERLDESITLDSSYADDTQSSAAATILMLGRVRFSGWYTGY